MKQLHGWLILDKPPGISSAAAVARVKKTLRRLDYSKIKIGHAGTLDPMAEGILPLALGDATRLVEYMMGQDKAYRMEVVFGEARDTDDLEGAVIAQSAVRPTRAMVEAALPAFLGKIDQIPPQYSALKIQGKRAYDLARKGAEFTLLPRKIDVFDLKIVETTPKTALNDEKTPLNGLILDVSCGKGAYMRAIARDLGQKLGSYGYMTALRRVKVGKFGENQAISLDFLEEIRQYAPLEAKLLPLSVGLDDILALTLSSEEAMRFIQGQRLTWPQEKNPSGNYLVKTKQASAKDVVLGMGEIENGVLHPRKVFAGSKIEQ